MHYLSRKSDVEAVLVVGGNTKESYPPKFYLNKYSTPVMGIADDFAKSDLDSSIAANSGKRPNYVIFFNEENLDDRVTRTANALGRKLVLEKVETASNIDALLCFISARNETQTGFVYRADKN
jgi:mevalonate pyrophosphate decarboxylase